MTANKIHLLSPEIVEQIYNLQSWISKLPQYNLENSKKITKSLEKEADRHSVNIEYPNQRVNKRQLRKEVLEAAKYFAEKYQKELSHNIIMGSWQKIMGQNCSSYRNGGFCMASGMNYFYPNNVLDQMDSFFINNSSLDTFLEKALHSHFHLTRIHPFNDGNGRLARLVQNGILKKGELPPIVISKFDRRNYFDLLNSAQRSYDSNEGKMTSEQAKFYNYLGMSLWDSLNRLKKKL